jgi:GWxTD domain-containing protein
LTVHGLYPKLALLALLAMGCQSNRQYTSKPVKNLPASGNENVEIHAVAYHVDDSTTKIFLEINNEYLLYKRPDSSQSFFAQFRVGFRALPDPYSRKIIDSGSYYMLDRVDRERAEARKLYTNFELWLSRGNNAELDIEIFDLNKKSKHHAPLSINKMSDSGREYYLVTVHDSVAFRNYFPKKEKIDIRYLDVTVSQVTVDCFLKEIPPALPPFTMRQNEDPHPDPDSSFVIQAGPASFSLTMPEQGFYFVRPDPRKNEGITLMTFDKSFPGVGGIDHMISCCRYIMSREEFEACQNAPDKKAAIDKFWLGIGGSNERARELLKRYYGRVKEANRNFTSYCEGWKTDRGMIFIIFGPPVNVYHSRRDEVWVYGNEANPGALRFIFNKLENRLSNNDYLMERSQFYKEPWHTAVDYWRQGTIYMESRR